MNKASALQVLEFEEMAHYYTLQGELLCSYPRGLLYRNHVLDVIREIRAKTHIGLREAKALWDNREIVRE